MRLIDVGKTANLSHHGPISGICNVDVNNNTTPNMIPTGPFWTTDHGCSYRGQVRQGAVRPQERAPNYPVIAAWSAFLLFIGAGAFVVGMAIHNESFAQQRPPRPEPIYYCATGEEIPLYEPCKERKDQRDI
jgi:hypothetical protein